MGAVAELAADAQVAAGLGHNNPPEPTPYDAIKVHIEDLWTEAKNWADGAKIENQAQADTVAKLIEDFRQAHQAADEARKDENKPYDDGKAAVQAKYAPLIADTKAATGLTVKAMAALKATLTPWLQHLERERQAAAAAAAAAAAMAVAEAAAAAKALDPGNLDEVEAAERLVAEAHVAQSAAKAAAGAKAHAKGDGRAIGLRTEYRAEITDMKAAMLHYMKTRPDSFTDLVAVLAGEDAKAKRHTVPGVVFHAETRV